MICMPSTRAPNSPVDLRTGLRPTPLRRRRVRRREHVGLARRLRPRVLPRPGAHDARYARRALREQGQASARARRVRLRTLIITTPFPRGPHVPRPARTYASISMNSPTPTPCSPLTAISRMSHMVAISSRIASVLQHASCRTLAKLHKRRHHCRCAYVFA